MKNSDKKKLGNNILKGILSFVKGATTANPIVNMAVGAVEGVTKSIEENKASEVGGVGSIDYAGLIGSIGGLIIIVGGAVAIAKGWLTIDDVTELFKAFTKAQ